jgi:hypothetical protein
MLSEVAGQPPASLSASLAELVRSELVFRIGTPPDARYTFNHVLVQQTTYETLLRSRRKDLHARVANAIVRLQRDDTDPLLLHHATLADDHELVARACKAAGDRSLRIFAHEEAYRLAERGLVHLGHLPDGERKVRFQIGLLSIKVHAAYKYRDEIPNLLVRLEEAADVAITLGLHNEAVAAFYAKAWLQQWSNDTRGASETVLRAEETSRKADEMTRCYQVANTGRCLLEVELQIPRALAMVDEAETMSQRLNLHFVELEWARAHAARWTGDLDRAHALLTRAVDLARLREERWRQVECIIWLAMIELERRNLQSVERYCDEIDEIAERLEHALPPVAAAFRVLARTGSRHRDLLPTIGQALTALRDFDDKAHLAYVLNFSAQDALAEGQVAWASCAAHEALTAAGAMSLTTETVVAASILARIACADGDREAAAARIQALVSECEPETLSARAKASLEQAAQHAGLDLKLPPTNIVA